MCVCVFCPFSVGDEIRAAAVDISPLFQNGSTTQRKEAILIAQPSPVSTYVEQYNTYTCMSSMYPSAVVYKECENGSKNDRCVFLLFCKGIFSLALFFSSMEIYIHRLCTKMIFLFFFFVLLLLLLHSCLVNEKSSIYIIFLVKT